MNLNIPDKSNSESAIMSQSRTAILQLPDELLVDIADGVAIVELHALSLACYRMRPIMQELLIKRATVAPENVWKLTGMLRAHPDLVASFTHLRLGPMTMDAARDMYHTHSVAWDTYKKCSDHGARDAAKSIVCFFESMTALFTLAHSLKAISMSAMADTVYNEIDKALHAFGSHNKPTTISAYRLIRQARSDLQARLEEINVGASLVSDYLHNSLIMGLAPVAFSSLKRLVIPYEGLFDKICVHDWDTFGHRSHDPATTALHQILPPSLESFHVSISHKRLWPDTQWLDRLIADDVNFPKLREVQLLYPYNIVSMGWHYRSMPFSNRKELPAALQRWQASRVNLTTAFGTTKFREVGWEPPSGNLSTAFGTRKLYVDARQTERHYIPGDLIPVIEKCLATTHDQLENEPEMMAALGYELRSI
ncbi:hypothetical protein BKA58DRAFT_391457 [Alternaria rosae]|uniref:uncharacterized protein n=1 Tax=Alternaria rosae TaxID=1187941 RepID=UPI001E8E2370|nr:uncharacterized protein BKA58DRAFT_391457 [Alternaria rosae]KAH6865139.1 hypothetical protein BKA58DRAFT_391457 [Alternaria rosae]